MTSGVSGNDGASDLSNVHFVFVWSYFVCFFALSYLDEYCSVRLIDLLFLSESQPVLQWMVIGEVRLTRTHTLT